MTRDRRGADRLLPPISRRRWLAGIAAGVALGTAGAIGQEGADRPGRIRSEADRLEVIRRRASGAGLPELRLREGERYVALASSREDFVAGALRLCEGLADDFLDHFNAKGFAVEPPGDRMALVALADFEQFGRFLGEELPSHVTGIYEIGPNYLVLYDGRGGIAGPGAERANTITLFHEATHQLTFNTGILDRRSDIPLVVSEGLAMYGEVRRPDGRTKVGAVNAERRATLARELRRGHSLIPLADLIADDEPFDRDETVQLSYAQSWLFIYGLLRNDRTAERFRSYLGALRGGDRGRSRVELAEEHLGDLTPLDDSLKSYAARLLRGR